MKLKKMTTEKLCVFVLLYCNFLKVFLGSWAPLVSDFLLVFLLFKLFLEKTNAKIGFSLLFLLLLIFLALFSVINPNIYNKLYALIEFRKTFFQFFWLIIGICFNKSSNKTSRDDFLKYVQIISLPIILYGIKQSIWFDSFDKLFYELQDADSYTYIFHGSIRSISVFSGPFHFGFFCNLILIISLYNFSAFKGKVTFLVFSLFAFWGIISSQTRTNLICSILIIWVFIWYIIDKSYKNFSDRFSIKIFFMCMSMVLIPFIFLAQPKSDNLLSSIIHFSEDNRFLGRISTWQDGLNLIKDNLLLGYGIGSAGDTMGQHTIGRVFLTPHNMFLKVAIELGFLGFTIFVGLLAYIFVRCYRLRDKKSRYLCLSLLLIIIVQGLVGSTLATFPIMSIIFILIGRTISCEKKSSQEMIYGKRSESLS